MGTPPLPIYKWGGRHFHKVPIIGGRGGVLKLVTQIGNRAKNGVSLHILIISLEITLQDSKLHRNPIILLTVTLHFNKESSEISKNL